MKVLAVVCLAVFAAFATQAVAVPKTRTDDGPDVREPVEPVEGIQSQESPVVMFDGNLMSDERARNIAEAEGDAFYAWSSCLDSDGRKIDGLITLTVLTGRDPYVRILTLLLADEDWPADSRLSYGGYLTLTRTTCTAPEAGSDDSGHMYFIFKSIGRSAFKGREVEKFVDTHSLDASITLIPSGLDFRCTAYDSEGRIFKEERWLRIATSGSGSATEKCEQVEQNIEEAVENVGAVHAAAVTTAVNWVEGMVPQSVGPVSLRDRDMGENVGELYKSIWTLAAQITGYVAKQRCLEEAAIDEIEWEQVGPFEMEDLAAKAEDFFPDPDDWSGCPAGTYVDMCLVQRGVVTRSSYKETEDGGELTVWNDTVEVYEPCCVPF
jgi:hypothetical protein